MKRIKASELDVNNSIISNMFYRTKSGKLKASGLFSTKQTTEEKPKAYYPGYRESLKVIQKERYNIASETITPVKKRGADVEVKVKKYTAVDVDKKMSRKEMDEFALSYPIIPNIAIRQSGDFNDSFHLVWIFNKPLFTKSIKKYEDRDKLNDLKKRIIQRALKFFNTNADERFCDFWIKNPTFLGSDVYGPIERKTGNKIINQLGHEVFEKELVWDRKIVNEMETTFYNETPYDIDVLFEWANEWLDKHPEIKNKKLLYHNEIEPRNKELSNIYSYISRLDNNFRNTSLFNSLLKVQGSYFYHNDSHMPEEDMMKFLIDSNKTFDPGLELDELKRICKSCINYQSGLKTLPKNLNKNKLEEHIEKQHVLAKTNKLHAGVNYGQLFGRIQRIQTSIYLRKLISDAFLNDFENNLKFVEDGYYPRLSNYEETRKIRDKFFKKIYWAQNVINYEVNVINDKVVKKELKKFVKDKKTDTYVSRSKYNLLSIRVIQYFLREILKYYKQNGSYIADDFEKLPSIIEKRNNLKEIHKFIKTKSFKFGLVKRFEIENVSLTEERYVRLTSKKDIGTYWFVRQLIYTMNYNHYSLEEALISIIRNEREDLQNFIFSYIYYVTRMTKDKSKFCGVEDLPTVMEALMNGMLAYQEHEEALDKNVG